MASSARIDELRKKFEENPRRYFAPLANEYRKAGDIEQAISICREYLPQQPGHMSGHIVFGQALYEARNYEEARGVFETALALDPENLIALRHLGDIALIVGEIDGARTWYGRVLEADPRNEEIQAQLKSLETVAPAAPTPLSTPTIEPTTAAPVTSSGGMPPTPAAAAPIPSLELTMPGEMVEPQVTPASSAPTVVMPAVPAPAIERTVEIAATPPSVPLPSLSTAPTAEITLDQVPVPAVPDLEKAAEAPGADLPVEKTAGYESTAPAAGTEPAVAPSAGPEATAPGGAETSRTDSFTLEGLETTSMVPPPSAIDPTPASVSEDPSTPVSEIPSTPASEIPSTPVAEISPASVAEISRAPAADISPAPAAEIPPAPEVEAPSPTVAAVTFTPPPEPASEPTMTSLPQLENAPPQVEASPADAAATAEPPAAGSELTFLDVGEATPPVASTASSSAPSPRQPERAPEPAPDTAMAESKPFVTETMAELYEQQGHRDEALRVYRALIAQRPNDDHIRARIEQLEGKRGPTIRELLSRAAARRPSPAATQAESQPATTPAAELSSAVVASAPAAPTAHSNDALPSTQAAPADAATPSTPNAPSTPTISGPTAPLPTAAESMSRKPRNDGLGQLFASAPVGGADENAAVTLSAAFSNDGRANGGGSASHLQGTPARPASKDLSLDAVFGTENAAPPAGSFSFDQFFSERATAEQPSPGARNAVEGQETKEDTARFTQWLEGLKQR